MGLFDKKFCDICGDKIGLLGNRKLEDGNMCKDCAKKLSPFFVIAPAISAFFPERNAYADAHSLKWLNLWEEQTICLLSAV